MLKNEVFSAKGGLESYRVVRTSSKDDVQRFLGHFYKEIRKVSYP